MDIIKRNFFKILRNEVFEENETIEPMSKYKWNKLIKTAEIHGVEGYVRKVLKEESDMPYGRRIPDAGMSKMYNTFLNNRLQKIRTNEPLATDASIETLNILDIIVQATEAILTNGLLYSYIIRIGLFLRKDGDKVDFVKLEEWLRKLSLTKMAQLEGDILIQTLGFEKDEIPFANNIMPSTYKLAIDALEKPVFIDNNDWKFHQSSQIFISSNSQAAYKTIHNCMKYIFYAPIEATSCLISKFKDSLSTIEE